jgi:CPA2 family monovalent cation:H+ antiporter-2
MVISVASTMVLARLLIDRGELHSRHGRIMIGITLVEDLAVVVLILLIPRLGELQPGRLAAIAGGLGLALAVLVPLLYFAAKVVPSILTRVARMQNQELFLLVTLALALGTAAVTQAIGLSLALGAFLAGLIISESDYAHETLARLLPLRDAFVALFFVTVGALINPAAVLDNLAILGVIVGLVIGGKFLIWTVVVRLFGYPTWTAVLVAIGLTQIGEFSFILIQVARTAGHVSGEIYNATLAASLLTILINAALVRYVPGWIGSGRLAGQADTGPLVEPPRLREHVVICGFGRVGGAVAEALEAFQIPYAAVDLDPDVVRHLRPRGVHAVYGDAAHRGILEAARADRAALVIVALPEFERARLAVGQARALNPDAPILARAHHAALRERLLQAGATEVIQPEFEAAATLIRHALRRFALPRDRVLAYLERLRAAMETVPAAETPGETLPGIGDVVLDSRSFVDQSLRDAALLERFGVTVTGITRADGEYVSQPTADTVLRAGDRLRLFGLPGQFAALQRALDLDASRGR